MYELIQKVVGEIHEHNWYRIPAVISTILIIVSITLITIGNQKNKDKTWKSVSNGFYLLLPFPIVHIFMLLLMLGVKNWD